MLAQAGGIGGQLQGLLVATLADAPFHKLRQLKHFQELGILLQRNGVEAALFAQLSRILQETLTPLAKRRQLTYEGSQLLLGSKKFAENRTRVLRRGDEGLVI